MNAPQHFDLAGLRPFYESPAAAEAPALPRDESKLPNAAVRLSAPRAVTTAEPRREFSRLRQTRRVLETLQRLPGPGEAIHCVCDGSYSLWHFVEAVLQLTGKPIALLSIVTLSMSKANVARLDKLVTAGHVGEAEIIVSCYHAAADREIYSQATAFCRRHGFRIGAFRSHAKLLLCALEDGRRIAVESSANLRSCHNVETATVFSDPDLYAFHRQWINELLNQASEK